MNCIRNTHFNVKPMKNNILSLCLLSAVLLGCHSSKTAGKKNDDFFTSGSRDADQRASQRMAKAEQLAGSGEGAGEKGVKKAEPVKKVDPPKKGEAAKTGADETNPDSKTNKAAVVEGK